jgi:uncharacterized membrane protein
VYAIAATLLALDIHAPITNALLRPEHLATLLPSIGVYALSFIVIGLFWVSHHRMFEMIGRADYALVWLNILVLMTVAFLPVPNATFAEHAASPYAVVFYAIVVIITAVTNLVLWGYATHRRRYLHPSVSSTAVRSIFRRHAMTIVVQLVAIPIAFVSTMVAFALMLVYVVASIASVIAETWRDEPQ